MNNYVINALDKRSHISKEIYGHFSEHLGRCIYEGLYVGEDSPIPNVRGLRKDVVEALRDMGIPVLRWPGGCFADEYHWKDGVGKKENRKKMINTHWGGVLEDNSFGTHEFLDLCQQLGCEPYINGNVGSGTVQEMSEWVEYMTFDGVSPMADWRKANGRQEPWRVKYFAVGNENWGCGGNMRPEYYADEFRRYQTYARNYGDNRLFRVACGPNADDYTWTRVLMERAGQYMDGLSLHYYTVPGDWKQKGPATGFDKAAWYRTLKKGLYMEELLARHGAIMDSYDPAKRVALVVDEWGAWYDVEPGTNPGFLYQQNSMRDAALAALTLNLFNHHSDRVRMANLAQTVNVLQSVILTDGAEMLLTPTYHVFRLFKPHQDGTLLGTSLETDRVGQGEDSFAQLSESASMDESGRITLTMANLSADAPAQVSASLVGFRASAAKASLLHAPFNAFNSFEDKERVRPVDFTDFSLEGDRLRFTLPACGIVAFTLEP